MAEEVSVIDFWTTPFGMRVRIALEEKGVEYQFIEESLMTTQRSPLLLEMNPVHKKIPVFIHKGRPICESSIIIQYIDEVWNDDGSPLLPSDPQQRAHARFWVDFIDQKIYVYGKKIRLSKGEEQEAAKKELIECLRLLEGELRDEPFFGGDALGFVDVALIPFYTWFYSLEKCGNFSIESECPKLVAWCKRSMERESVFKSLSDQHKVYEFVLEFKKKSGVE